MRRDHEWRDPHWLVAIALFFLCVFVAWQLLNPPKAFPQSGGFISSGRQDTTPDARFKYLWNATGAEIADGTLVMIDTVAAGVGPQIPLGKGFRTWDADVSHFYRIVGITVNNTPGFSKGKVLVEGLHNNALMDSTGCTGLSLIRVSKKTAGCLHVYIANPDSLNTVKKAVGVFQRYVSGTSLRAQVYVNFSAQVFSK